MAVVETAPEVPDYSVTEFHPRRHSHCVSVFVLNEGERIIRQLERMHAGDAQADIMVADGGSTDGALEHKLLRRLGVRTLLVKRGRGKLSAQMRMAFDYALREGYRGVVTMDGNNKDDPAAIPLFVQALEAGFEHIQGSRFIPGGQAINTPWLRLLAIRFIHAPLISLAAGFRYTDTTNGFRAYSRSLLLDPRVAPLRHIFSTYELHYYLAIRAVRLGYRVKEMPVTRSYPRRGPTPTKISFLKGNFHLLRVLLAACCHRFDPPRPARGQGRSSRA